jgi:hypothetical protein
VSAQKGDPEFGVSRGRLLPNHRILLNDEVTAATRQKLQDSPVLVHGGMAQDVGPILEMVTERYLLRSNPEWQARQQALGILGEIERNLRSGDVRAIGNATERNFEGPIQTIIPWASNIFTETLIQEVRAAFGSDFWGFWMLGGMSGGGMGFIFDPARKTEAQHRLAPLMGEISHRLAGGVPFAMKPVVYNFAINERGTFAELLVSDATVLPDRYYNLMLPAVLRREQREITASERSDLTRFSMSCYDKSNALRRTRSFLDCLLPSQRNGEGEALNLSSLLAEYGFDPVQHERIQIELRAGQIGLTQNRLPTSIQIEDVSADQVFFTTIPFRMSSPPATSPTSPPKTISAVKTTMDTKARFICRRDASLVCA